MINPSRFLSKGREAFSGASLRVERAVITFMPAIAIEVIAASAAPASITSAAPRRIISAASPMAFVPEAQAVARDMFGPRAPTRMAMLPAAPSEIIIGMRKGLTRSGPRWRRISYCSTRVVMPPMPEPIKIPTRLRLTSSMIKPDCARASSVATVANWVKRSILRASRVPNKATGSKPLTSAANLVLCALASKWVMGAAPDFPANSASQVSFTLFPTGLTQPKPVITTRVLIRILLDKFLCQTPKGFSREADAHLARKPSGSFGLTKKGQVSNLSFIPVITLQRAGRHATNSTFSSAYTMPDECAGGHARR